MAETSSDSSSAPQLFCGWIPTVSGRLSFSVFGDCRFPTVATAANVVDDNIRYFAAHQFRDASDVLLPFRKWLSPLVFGIDGRMWFAFLAHTESKPDDPLYTLSGRAFIFADPSRWKIEVSPKLIQFQDHLRDFQYHKDHDDLERFARQQYADALELCTKTCSYFIDAKIRRNGVTEILIPAQVELPASATKLPSDERKKARTVRLLASQLFFFLKDLGHRHQHHDPSTDQIVSIHETTSPNDIRWRNLTLYSIYRKVIEIKRDPHAATFSNSLGLVAYAEAFSKILREDLDIEEGDKRIPAYYSDAMKDSINSTQDKSERDAAKKTRAWDIVRTTVISLTGLLISYVGLLRLAKNVETDDVHPSPMMLELLKWLLNYPLQTGVVLALLVCIAVKAFTLDRSDVSAMTISIVRRLHWLPRWMIVSIASFIGAVSLSLFVALLP